MKTTVIEQRIRIKALLVGKGLCPVAVNKMVDAWEDDDLYDNMRSLIAAEVFD